MLLYIVFKSNTPLLLPQSYFNATLFLLYATLTLLYYSLLYPPAGVRGRGDDDLGQVQGELAAVHGDHLTETSQPRYSRASEVTIAIATLTLPRHHFAVGSHITHCHVKYYS